MLKHVRQKIIHNLWVSYHDTTPHVLQIEQAMQRKGIQRFPLDHLAIIDLPGPHSGIPVLKEIFTALGFTVRGSGYLPDKQNDFVWLTEIDSEDQLAPDVLPQVVVADFRPEEMSQDIATIVNRYSHQCPDSPLQKIRKLVQRTTQNDETAAAELIDVCTAYFTGRDWPLPTVGEFNRLQAYNELLAWVLVFGRRPNHFTVSVHLLEQFADLNEFNRFVEEEAKLTLNQEGGVIKGNSESGIAQGSTVGITQTIQLADGKINLPTGFVEFVWRYPRQSVTKAERWNDYFTGFVAQYANHVIESLYTER